MPCCENVSTGVDISTVLHWGGSSTALLKLQFYKQLFSFSMVTVKTCPSLHPPANGTISTTVSLYDTIVEVECVPGFSFPDKSTRHVLQCMSTGRWNATLQDCQGSNFVSLAFFQHRYALIFLPTVEYFDLLLQLITALNVRKKSVHDPFQS